MSKIVVTRTTRSVQYMARPFDPKLKQEIIAAVKSGSMTQSEACRMYGVSSASMSTRLYVSPYSLGGVLLGTRHGSRDPRDPQLEAGHQP